MAQVGGEMWRKNALYEIMDGKTASLVGRLQQDPELKTWRCKAANDECNGFTLLHAAVRFGNPGALSLLLENGAVQILAKDKGGKTPLEWAIQSSESGMVRAMLECAAAGNAPMPNLELALKQAEVQLEGAERTRTKPGEAKEVVDMLTNLIEEEARARRAGEEAAAAEAAEAARRLQEEMERAAKAEAEAAAARAAKEAEERRRQLEAEAQARLEEEARQREAERLRLEAEAEEEEARRNARDAKTQMIHFNSLVESSLLRKGIGKDAPIIVVRVRPLSTAEAEEEPASMLCDATDEHVGFGEGDAPGSGRLAPGPSVDERYALGDSTRGYRLFGCHTLQRDRDAVYGTDGVQYNDADMLNAYFELGGTIIDSMTKGTNCTVIACGGRGAGKSYALGRPFHERPYERDEFDEAKGRWSAGKLVKSDEAGLVERVGRDLMSYRTVLQSDEPTAKLFVMISCLVVYHEKVSRSPLFLLPWLD